MPRYDFKALSPQDFEELTRDLLQAEWGCALEAFKTGRDNGIDLRYAKAGESTTVVQCKHYSGSTFSKLLAHLRDEELPKVVRLAPDRYVTVTSMGLSPADKQRIVEVMHPFVVSPEDVIGLDDLNGLLSRHTEIERRNFKLWLTSTEVITRVLHNAEACQTEFEVEQIRKKLPLFVQSDAYPRARRILDEQRVVIVSGVPGIGKTTLADMLLFAHLDDGYEPIVIQTDVAEGKRLFSRERKQIFYYDDFLGQTFLGDQRSYIGRNHDAALLALMEMVRNTPHSRFILTTREHILRQAMQASERLQHSAAQTYKCILALNDYTFGQRARILYNHLYFSDLPRKYKEAILQDDFFLKIIKHEHFNPRLIEWLTTLTRLSNPVPESYCRSIATLLDSPARIWSHAFEHQISHAAKSLLIALYSLGEWSDVEQLENAFDAIHRGSSVRYNRPRSTGDFRTALQEVEGSFLSYSSGRAHFLNPSIRDFMASVFRTDEMVTLELITDAVRFKQLSNIWKIALEPAGEALRASIVANSAMLRANAERLMAGDSMRWESTPKGQIGIFVDTSEEWRLDQIAEWCEAIQNHSLVELAHAYVDLLLVHWEAKTVDFRSAVGVLNTMKESEWFMANGGAELYRKVLDGLLSHVERAWANDWAGLLELPEHAVDWTDSDDSLLTDGLDYYLKSGIDDERYSCGDTSQMNELKDTLEGLEKKYGLGIQMAIASIEAAIEELEERDNPDDGEGGGFSRRPGTAAAIEPMNDADVRAMFQSILHREH